ncbi:ABC transporter substrate-binding protein [Methanobacterium sp. ACI-7]|uniref:ABC transporter substrate-binding protein n=1 Tax=unclassified Methanobacterium TaxID=2627676 RepID=UPI0039C247A3
MRKIATIIVIITIILAGVGTYNYYSTINKTVTIGYLPSDHHAALFVANFQGMYEKEDIRVQLVPFRAGPEIIKALEEGEIDVGYCGISPVITAIDNGKPIKIVAAVNQEGSGIVANSNIKTINDLKSKRVAIPQKGSVQDILLKDTLKSNNISLSDVQIIESEVPYMPKSLLFNKFDAFVAWEPYPSAAQIDENETILAYSEELWEDHPCCVIITTDDYAKSSTNKLNKILSVHREATNYINSHKNETVLIISKKLGTEIEVEEESLKHVEFVSDLSDNFVNNVFKIVEIQKQLEYTKNNITKEQLFNFQYMKQ